MTPSALFRLAGLVLILLFVNGCATNTPATEPETASDDAMTPAAMEADAEPAVDPAVLDTATFAGGCFWCMEPPFDKLDGVTATTSGFAGGTQPNPTYRQVSSGQTDYTEVVQVIYDTTRVSYEQLLETYWPNVDPFDAAGQFCDRGSQYRPAIFYHDDEQQRLAEASREAVDARFEEPLAVPVQPLQNSFYPAEDYHQNFYKTNPVRYKTYRTGCRRDARLAEVWGDDVNGLDLSLM